MRKLIVLIMTSVLATGAVAQADQVNVTEDAGNLIFIDSIFEEDQATLFDPSSEPTGVVTDVTSLQPTKPGATLGSGRTEKYSIRGAVAQTFDGAEIEQIAVCFYDTRVEDAVADLCGYGSAGVDLATTVGDKGTNSPDSALQANVKTPSLDGSFYTDLSFENDNTENVHYVRAKPDSNAKQLSDQTFFDDGVAKDAVYFVVRAALSHAMAAGATAYKVRVVAIYDNNSVFSLTDTRTYSVDTYHSIGTNREAVRFEDMNPGDQRLKTGINAGEYYANTTANFSISATEFEISGVAASSVPFSTDNPGMGTLTAGEKFWMMCMDNDSSPIAASKYLTTSGQSFYSNKSGSNTQPDPEAPKTLSDTMRCQLSVGDDVSFGEYTNTVDMGISQ